MWSTDRCEIETIFLLLKGMEKERQLIPARLRIKRIFLPVMLPDKVYSAERSRSTTLNQPQWLTSFPTLFVSAALPATPFKKMVGFLANADFIILILDSAEKSDIAQNTETAIMANDLNDDE